MSSSEGRTLTTVFWIITVAAIRPDVVEQTIESSGRPISHSFYQYSPTEALRGRELTHRVDHATQERGGEETESVLSFVFLFSSSISSLALKRKIAGKVERLFITSSLKSPTRIPADPEIKRRTDKRLDSKPNAPKPENEARGPDPTNRPLERACV